MKQNNSALYSVLSFLLIAVLMLSVVGVIMRYTNGGTTDFALFYVAHDGQSIMTDTTITLSDGETATFAPKYAADDIMHSIGQGTEKKGYNVKSCRISRKKLRLHIRSAIINIVLKSWRIPTFLRRLI